MVGNVHAFQDTIPNLYQAAQTAIMKISDQLGIVMQPALQTMQSWRPATIDAVFSFVEPIVSRTNRVVRAIINATDATRSFLDDSRLLALDWVADQLVALESHVTKLQAAPLTKALVNSTAKSQFILDHATALIVNITGGDVAAMEHSRRRLLGHLDLGSSHSSGCTLGSAHMSGCTTAVVSNLTNQIIELMKGHGTLVQLDETLASCDEREGCIPLVHEVMAAALRNVTEKAGQKVTLSSAFRSSAQQFVLCKWKQGRHCSQTFPVAPPGGSGHEAGMCVDVPGWNETLNYSTQRWLDVLEEAGLSRPLPTKDPVHFCVDGHDSPDLRKRNLMALQQLSNANQPPDQRLSVTGKLRSDECNSTTSLALDWSLGSLELAHSKDAWSQRLPQVQLLQSLCKLAYENPSTIDGYMSMFACGCYPHNLNSCDCTWSDVNPIPSEPLFEYAYYEYNQRFETLVLHDHRAGVIVVAFEGTDLTSLTEWKHNLNFDDVHLHSNSSIRVHEGFLEAFLKTYSQAKLQRGRCRSEDGTVCPQRLREFLSEAYARNSSSKLLITGHSLGGAMASIASVYLSKLGPSSEQHYEIASLVTFGAPRAGCGGTSDEESCFPCQLHKLVPSAVRVTRHNDVVSKLPPKMTSFVSCNYQHAPHEVFYGMEAAITIQDDDCFVS